MESNRATSASVFCAANPRGAADAIQHPHSQDSVYGVAGAEMTGRGRRAGYLREPGRHFARTSATKLLQTIQKLST